MGIDCVSKIKQIWIKHRWVICMCVLAATLCSVYAGFLANKSVPPAEGWYSYYAYIINEEGAIPYVDFELLFPPLYTYIIALFTRVFGYDLIALRVLGVVIYALTGVFACLIFYKLTKKTLLGFIGGMLAVAVLQGEAVQIFYDYIRVMDLFVYISIYFFIRYLDKTQLDVNNSPKFNINIVFGTIFAVLASMCKQSSGLIFLIFCFMFMAFFFICLSGKRELGLQLGVMACITIVLYGIMVVFLSIQGSLSSYINYNFVSSVDAKGGGSMFSIIFGWIPRSGRELLISFIIMLVPVALLVLSVWLSHYYPAKECEEHPKFVLIIRIAVPVLLVMSVILPFACGSFATFMAKLNASILMYIMFLFCTVFFAVSAFSVIFRKKIKINNLQQHFKYVFLSGVIFVLAFSVCTSGGLAESQIALGYAFVPIVILMASQYRKREIATTVLCVIMLLQSSVMFSRKVNQIYSWWGLSTGSYSEQIVTCDIPMFKGIKVNAAYYKMYNDVYRDVIENTEPGDEIFVFPHMPVLYVATDRPRVTHTAIQWFDVSTDSAIIKDIHVINEKMPKVMVLCSVGDFVIQSHENNFRGGDESGLHKMQNFLMDFVEEEGYECLSRNEISDGYVVTVWRLN